MAKETNFCYCCYQTKPVQDFDFVHLENRLKPFSNGNCSEDKFFRLIRNNHFTEIHDYENEYQDGKSSFIEKNGGYYEINKPWYLKKHKPKYFYSFDNFMNFFFDNYNSLKYVRFSPGGSYLIEKQRILFYPREFYSNIKKILSWGIVIGDAHIVERALYLIFSNRYNLRKSNNINLLINQIKTFFIYWFIYFPLEIIFVSVKKIFSK